ncbi:MAG: hypothetical protein GXP55_08590 [Deltaproteobacteria bacterium]|nr:hypothetical protein [Deltaproteobacteria bacterium]
MRTPCLVLVTFALVGSFAFSAQHAEAQHASLAPPLTLAPEFAEGLDAPAPHPTSTVSISGIDPEIIRLQLERPPPSTLGRRNAGRWLVTVGAPLMLIGSIFAATLGSFYCHDTGEQVHTMAYAGGITAAVGLAFTIGGAIRLARRSVPHQRGIWGRRLGYALASILFAGLTSSVLFAAAFPQLIGCD